MLSPAGRCCALTGLLMTSDFDPDGAVKLRAFSPSGSGIAAASHLHESQGKNSCFLRSQPPDAPAPPACGAAVAIPNSVCGPLLLWPPWLWPFPAARGADLLKFRYSREVQPCSPALSAPPGSLALAPAMTPS